MIQETRNKSWKQDGRREKRERRRQGDAGRGQGQMGGQSKREDKEEHEHSSKGPLKFCTVDGRIKNFKH